MKMGFECIDVEFVNDLTITHNFRNTIKYRPNDRGCGVSIFDYRETTGMGCFDCYIKKELKRCQKHYLVVYFQKIYLKFL